MERKGRENHGLVSHPLYTKWSLAKNRCFNKKGVQFHDYGDRGITVCDEWSYNFKAFYDYMMGLPNAMQPGYSIDRINNDGNYEPGNMRWSTYHVQTANRRPNKGRKYRGVYKLQNKYKGKLYSIRR